MKKIVAGMMGVMVSGLAVAHFMANGKKRIGPLNVERNLTMARIPIALSLLRAGFLAKDRKVARSALTSVGASYIGMGGTALFDRNLGGMVKKGFTNADIAFHLVTGAAAMVIGLLPEKKPAKQ